MKSARLTLLLVIVPALLLTACAGRDRQPIYLDSEEIEPLRAPERLDAPTIRRTYQVDGYFLPEMAGQSEARPPRVLSSAEAEASQSRIRFGASGLYLEVRDEPDSVWRRLGFSLNRAGMQVQEIEQDRLRYDFRFNHDPIVIDRTGFGRLAFWRSPERVDHSGAFRVEVEPASGQTSRVLLLTQDGELVEMEQAEHVLSVLRERLG